MSALIVEFRSGEPDVLYKLDIEKVIVMLPGNFCCIFRGDAVLERNGVNGYRIVFLQFTFLFW